MKSWTPVNATSPHHPISPYATKRPSLLSTTNRPSAPTVRPPLRRPATTLVVVQDRARPLGVGDHGVLGLGRELEQQGLVGLHRGVPVHRDRHGLGDGGGGRGPAQSG